MSDVLQFILIVLGASALVFGGAVVVVFAYWALQAWSDDDQDWP